MHWKEGRSAMELAKAWFRNGSASPPVELISALKLSNKLNGIVIESGIPELVTPLPEGREGRNHDISLIGRFGDRQVTICVEAKADEPFGTETIQEYLLSSGKKLEKDIPTRIPLRIAHLLAMVGVALDDYLRSAWVDVRYQLLTALCGTAVQAKLDNSVSCVFLVHQFETESTEATKLEVNEREFVRLISALSGKTLEYHNGTLVGPFIVDGIDCLIGKITTKEQFR